MMIGTSYRSYNNILTFLEFADSFETCLHKNRLIDLSIKIHIPFFVMRKL